MHSIEARRFAPGRRLFILVALVFLGACRSSLPELPIMPIEPPLPPGLSVEPAVGRLARQVVPFLESNVGAQNKATLLALTGARTFPAIGKRGDALDILLDPWQGMAQLESYGLLVSALSKHGVEGLDDLLLTLEKSRVKPDHEILATKRLGGGEKAPGDTLAALLEQVKHHCDRAMRRLSTEDRQFLFDHAMKFLDDFSPQFADPDSQTKFLLYSNRRYIQLIQEYVEYDALVTAAQLATKLGSMDLLRDLNEALRTAPKIKKPPEGVKGDVLLVRETSAGTIVVGGPGPNTYQLDGRIALIIDLGGDDIYRGAVAAPGHVDQSVHIVIDLAGNDAYSPSMPLGLATGRGGIGLLIDKSGNDSYELLEGSGGTGFAGIGLLYDEKGNDIYTGSKFTQGAAIGGLGLLVDVEGDDQYHSFGYAIGFAGPGGIGVAADLSGHDNYQCGGKYPSVYNAVDVPDGDPNNPLYQFECFGVGVGSGIRILSKNQDDLAYALAGGLGMLLDLEGDDHYQTANFSQGTGYFFGIGVKLDLGGNDDHLAARYGLAAGAHYGAGLFIDYRGADYYDSTGPHYNAGAAWDVSVMLGIDAGTDDDTYSFERSNGLGVGHHNAWSAFIEEGGKDRYLVPRGLGLAEGGSVASFFDLAGADYYARNFPNGSGRRSNQDTISDSPGSLFMDRQ